jgi:transposase
MFEAPVMPLGMLDRLTPGDRGFVEALVAFNAKLLTELKELKVKLGLNSTNSSLPPSTDRPHVKRAPPRPPSGKKKGAQPGRARTPRSRLTPTRIVDLHADACRGCGHALRGDDPNPLVHQVIEIPPPPPPDVTEYRQHRRTCPGCGRVTCPPLPTHAQSGFGPRVQAIAAMLTGGSRLGKRAVAALIGDLFGVPISTGAVCKLQHRTADALAPIVAQARNYVIGRPANVDETTWTENRHSGYVWVAVTKPVTAFLISETRERVTLQDLIPGEPGTLTTDRLNIYYHLKDHQLCWAHLRRDFQALIDRQDEGSPIGTELLAAADRMLAAWKQVRTGAMTREAFRSGPLVAAQTAFQSLTARWVECPRGKKSARSVLYELSQLGRELWRFAEVDGVEPTNNAAERALRHGVFWRKLSFGTDSAKGSRFVEGILTVVESCRQQGRNLLSFILDAVTAGRYGTACPSILPAQS